MDTSNNTILMGPQQATLNNGATIIPGMIGAALYTQGNGAYAEFGNLPFDCLHHPDSCVYGVTLTFWVKFYSWPTDTYKFVIHSGGCRRDFVGLCVSQNTNYLGFVTRLSRMGYQVRIRNIALHIWHFISISFKDERLLFYNNGCSIPLIFTSSWVRNYPRTTSNTFTIGSMLDREQHSSHIALDQLTIWDVELSADDIWELYRLGGKV